MKRVLFAAAVVLSISVGATWADQVDDAKALASRGDVRAQLIVGTLYLTGQGVQQDHAEGVKWFRRAAEQGELMAQGALGGIYAAGIVVPQDYAESIKWYRLASAQGDMVSQRTLGGMYESGQGVPQNYVLAHMWLNLSSVAGNESAIEQRDNLASRMTSQQLAEAQKLAIDCQKRNFKGCD